MGTQTKPELTVSRPDLIADGSDLHFRQMLHDLLAFSSRLQQVRGRFAAFIGLTGPQYTILITIRQLAARDDATVGSVADHLALTPTFVASETKKLATMGIVEKDPDPMDMRRVMLSVSAKGEQLLHELAPVQRQINDALFSPVTAENFALLRSLSASLRNSAEDALALSDQLLKEAEEKA
ncbi:winged helix-turn-helix transcriptional regulator [Martelella alba]|uniref:Winged helix-turn-helix transcriptional regulator n=1 Tax=Martelella alba TaxID=2590451 RepID=A0A506U8Z2_9HYPH|nr:MarR family winged helix-turn-helix transcriptional regulator [Martelella alba]TPW29988.1 winged helix-turn-helix transcriptional regulator [Martelella alba]